MSLVDFNIQQYQRIHTEFALNAMAITSAMAYGAMATTRELMLTTRAHYFDGPEAIASAKKDFRCAHEGNGQPVIVLPGFCASNRETSRIRAYLGAHDYKAYGWKNGRNWGLTKKSLEKVSDQTKRIADKHGQPVKIAAWSLGTLAARYAANKNPQEVSSIVTAGGPAKIDVCKGRDVLPIVRLLYELLNGPIDSVENMALLEEAFEPVTQPLSAIITEGDIIVNEEASIPDPPPQSKKSNAAPLEIIKIGYEAGVTHCGMLSHPFSMAVIKNRLAEDSNDWNPINAATNPLGRHRHIKRVPIAA